MRKNSKNFLFTGGIAIVGTLLLAASAYLYSSNSYSKTSKVKSNRKSKCYILNKAMVESIYDWEEELAHDVVILVDPISRQFGTELKSCSKFEHKIILCNNWTAIWSCVRNLRKQELLLHKGSLPEPIPKDIARFVEDIILL